MRTSSHHARKTVGSSMVRKALVLIQVFLTLNTPPSATKLERTSRNILLISRCVLALAILYKYFLKFLSVGDRGELFLAHHLGKLQRGLKVHILRVILVCLLGILGCFLRG